MPAPRPRIAPAAAAVVLFACAGAVLPAACSQPSPDLSRGGNVTISLDVGSERPSYLPGSAVALVLRIRNGGAAAVEIADPADPSNAEIEYVVAGPAGPAGPGFTRRSAAEASGAVPSDDEPVPAARIEGGGVFEARVPIGEMADVTGIGEYRVSVRLSRPGAGVVRSGECVFRVDGFRTSAVHAGLGVSGRPAEGEGVLIDGGALHTFVFRGSAPEISEAEADPVVHRAPAGNARDAAVPSRNSPFFDELVRWLVWIDGPSVKALTSVETVPAVVALPAEPAALVKPPLKTKGGPVEVLALAPDRKSVTLVRFEQAAGPSAVRVAQGTAPWTAPLPAEARAITTALGSAGRGSERHLALATDVAGVIEIHHARFSESGISGAFESAHVPPRDGLRLLDVATPALHVDERGDAWASVLAVSGPRPHWIEARFPVGGSAAPEVRVTDLGPAAEGAPTDGAVLYVASPASAVLRREVVLLLGAGHVARWDGAALSVAALRGKPARPLVLVPGAAVTYLLYVDEARGPLLEPLE